MSDDYTPNAVGARSFYAEARSFYTKNPSEAHAEFDRWLAAHDAEVIEKARAEGIIGFSMEEICAKLGGSEAAIRADEREKAAQEVDALPAVNSSVVEFRSLAVATVRSRAATRKDGSHE